MSEVKERVASSVVTSENLAEFQATKLGLATKEPEPVTEPEPEASSEPEVVDEAKEQEEPQKKPNPKLERRFSDLTKQRELARQEAAEERRKREELEQRLKEYEVKTKPVETQPDAKPTPDQFSDAFEYAEKLAEWSANQAIKQRERQEAERKAAESRDQLIKGWQQKIQAAKSELPDFDDMVASSDVRVNDAIRDAIIESDVGPKLLYHFAENPELAEKLNGMSITSALRELGKLEAKFEKTEKEKVAPVSRPRAADPINPIRAVVAGKDTGIDSDGEFRGSFQDYRALRKAGKIR